ncbi:MAG: CHAP domain-containing protein, partial [Oscillospiraceae bacterium]|nr:CHAP domain-containing protein [Oscillospiraceae bacterium]
MRKCFTRMLSLVLVVVLLLSVASPALAATYRPGAQSGPSSSYASGMYYGNYKRVPITGDGRTDLIAIALSQLGYQEGNANGAFSGTVSGRYNYVEFSYNMGDLGLGYGGSDYPWCASFVSWCLYQSHNTDQNSWKDLGRYHVGDYKYIWKEISCSQWVRQLKGAGYYKYSKYEGGSYTPKYGDLVFFQNSGGVAHIGICLYVSGGRIYTVEGNTSDAAGLEPNGGGVYFKNYSLSTSYINGYGVLPYKSNSSVSKIDYSGKNPTPGLYVANAGKYIYATETATSHSWVMSRFTMFEVTQVCSNGRLKVIAKDSNGVTRTGYVSNNSDRVIQLSSTATDAVDTARANLQKVINDAEALRHYNYTEAQIYTIREAYNTACTLVGNTAATEAQLTAAAATLRNEMGKTGSNTIALNN